MSLRHLIPVVLSHVVFVVVDDDIVDGYEVALVRVFAVVVLPVL